jgi:hypothetical protein
VLYDVAIINDTLAYAVGEIYKRDSVGNWDPNAYNLAKWNGQRWELKRIYTYSTCNPVDYAPLRAIWAFSDSSILVTSGGSLGRYNGRVNTPDCSIRPLVTGSINKIWGSSENDVYVVGNNGFIAHYDGVWWRRIESGTRTHINDAWGVVNRVTGEEEVYCAVSSFFTPGDRRILRVKNETVDTIRWDIGRLLYSVWTNKSSFVYAAGSGVFQNKMGRWREEHTGSSIFINNIRGFGLNHIVVVGDFGYISHYNGLTWQIVGVDVNAGYSSVAVESNLVVAVGNRNGRAFIAIGRR